MKLIDISTDRHPNVFTMVDDEDFEWLSKFHWRAHESKVGLYAKSWNTSKYPKRRIYAMHREIMKTPEGMRTDHIDHNDLNNQRYNLRTCTASQNGANRKVNSTPKSSKYKGVYWHTGMKKFVAQIQFKKKSMRLGSFVNEDDAGMAYNKKAIELFGEFAFLNDVPTLEKKDG